MKKIFFSAFLLFAIVFNTKAQTISKNTIGLRVNSGIEATYQRALTNKNRLDFNLGWTNYDIFSSELKYNNIQLVGVYQWVWKLIGQFNWYAGAGLGLGYESKKNRTGYWNYDNRNNLYVVATGNIGIEYAFNFPLTLSLDFRPELDFDKNNYYNLRNSSGANFGISARYRF